MKDLYFTPENIASEAEAMIEEVSNYSGIRVFKPQIAGLALLVVDMQHYFLDSNEHAFIPSGPVVMPNILNLMKACKRMEVPIFLSQHINTEEDAAMMGFRWKELLKKDDHRCAIHEDVLAVGGEVIEKTQFDAFYHTDLEKRLKEKGIKQLIICGVMTNLCCETTARSAFVRGFEVSMPVDATAAYNYEFHLATFLNLAYIFSKPVKTHTLIQMIGKDRLLVV